MKLEILLRQWTKSNDVLFSIHPVDGSLLTWTVEWLDDHFRQPVISYSSRLPGALPSSDSMSLHSKLNTFNPHEPIYLDALRNDMENKDTSVLFHDKLLERRVSNTIHVLTSHDNGTLNLWHMSVDDQSSFSHVVSMTHISRMCGHRFQMQQVRFQIVTCYNFQDKYDTLTCFSSFHYASITKIFQLKYITSSN